MLSKDQLDLLLAEKEMLELEPIEQYSKYNIDTDYGASKRRYNSMRIKEIERLLELHVIRK